MRWTYRLKQRRSAIKTLIALLFVAAIFWLIKPETSPEILKNQAPQGIKSAQVDKASVKLPSKERAQAKPETVAPTGETAAGTEVAASITPVLAPTPPATDYESEAKAFIYQKESGNEPTALNKIGCYGLGQDCNGVVKNRCGSNYQCQDEYFTSYMQRRYGSWASAKQFWLSAVPIDGIYVGNWW